MSRTMVLLTALVAVALIALSFMFLIKPKMDEAAELRADAEDVRAEQSQLRTQIAALEEVRATSPNLEAELAAVSAIIPQEPALPAALRQLQMAADDSGVTLLSVAPGRPAATDVAEVPDLATISVSVSLEGGYFQVVDFLRRIEDPRVTSRGFLIGSVSASPSEYPVLAVTVNGQIFSQLEEAPAPAPEEPTDTEEDVDVDVDVENEDADQDVDVDVDVTEEDAA